MSPAKRISQALAGSEATEISTGIVTGSLKHHDPFDERLRQLHEGPQKIVKNPGGKQNDHNEKPVGFKA